jgi:xanthine/uracil/vitamin C permease (AzgA family)
LKHAIAVGIGLLIALIGLEWGGVIVASPGTFVTPGSLHSPPVLLTVCGLVVTSALLSRRAPGAILIGILASTLVGLAFGLVRYQGLVERPHGALGGFALAGPSVRGLVRRPTCLVDEMRQERHRAPYDSISH